MRRLGMENRYTHLLIRKLSRPLKQFPGMGLWEFHCPYCRNWYMGYRTQREALAMACFWHGSCLKKMPLLRHPCWPKS